MSYLMGIVNGNCQEEIYIHLLDLGPGTEAKNATLGPRQELNLRPQVQFLPGT